MIPVGMQCLVFNVQRPLFQDRRVRMALNYALDFEWMNKNLFTTSTPVLAAFFRTRNMKPKVCPAKTSEDSEPFGGKIPEEVFTQEYNPPITDGSGNIRTQLREALALLKEAGWEIQDKKLVNVETGQPLNLSCYCTVLRWNGLRFRSKRTWNAWALP